ncbi:hypothetical protein FSP39_016167 [Pinctada imbricata]|uniref:TIR domain-containing protein n=1 Tax=Pinctada imbricata TaxID=66713 RepID=A0AA88XX44_PINIB|nr:hypothetical protein FSP39_016167 [Pinctada imbricata]
MRELDEIAKSSNLTVNLTGNSLLCNCENEHFLHWIVTSTIQFGFHGNDTCQTRFSKTGRVLMSQGHEFLLVLERNCRSYTAVIVLFSCVFVIMLTVIVCGVVYRYRWKLRYLYYMTKGRYKGYSSLKTKSEEGDYEFDAFISYADEDRQFALHDMMKNVEREGNLKLCFHNRDFIPGFDIAENITNAINNSRKTLCVISSNYLNSYWCMYELNIGRMESIYSRNGEDVLFLVILENCSSSNIPFSVFDIIEKKSYIEYPNDTEGDIIFWRKLRDTISM